MLLLSAVVTFLAIFIFKTCCLIFMPLQSIFRQLPSFKIGMLKLVNQQIKQHAALRAREAHKTRQYGPVNRTIKSRVFFFYKSIIKPNKHTAFDHVLESREWEMYTQELKILTLLKYKSVNSSFKFKVSIAVCGNCKIKLQLILFWASPIFCSF